MAGLNKYYKSSRISEGKFREVVRYFCADLTAVQIARLSNLNINTINKIIGLIRERILAITEENSPPLSGQIEVDESYFGARRVRGRRGRGAQGKTIVFGVYKRGGEVYTEIVPDCSRAILQGVIRGKVNVDSVIHSDGWRGYNGLVDFGYKKHFRVRHNTDEFVRGTSHINGIESFWGYAKTRLAKLKGMRKTKFLLHLKECEFRFNHRKQDMYKILLKELRKHPLN